MNLKNFYWFILFILNVAVFVECNKKKLQGRFTNDLTEYEIVYPLKISASGRLLSQDVRHYVERGQHAHSVERHPAKNDTIHYKIAIDYVPKHITLEPNFDMVSEGALVESRGSYAHGRSIPNIKLHRLSEKHCHYHGYIDGERNSGVAISTCDGLAGYLMSKNQVYMIEPLNRHATKASSIQAHLLYKVDSVRGFNQRQLLDMESFCGTKGKLKPRMGMARSRMTHNWPHRRTAHKERAVHAKESKEYFLETLVVVDKTMIKYHKDLDLEQYILTVFNMAYNLYHDASLGAHINLAIVRIIRLEEDEAEMNNAVRTSASETLKNFCKWQEKQNPVDQSHPNHHDVAVFLTREDQCKEGTEDGCGLLGLAYTSGACKRESMCNICEDNGLMLGFVIAHEIGHNLGIDHDTLNETGCPENLPDGSITVMSPYLSMNVVGWSNCSQVQLHKFLESEQSHCMEDKPTVHNFKFENVLPGVLYDTSYQCQQIFSPNATKCDTAEQSCEHLKCEIPGKGCVQAKVVPAPGTPCGENKWCYHRKCITAGQRPGAVDGSWGSWSAWSPCSHSCGLAFMNSTRVCDSPNPAHGGRYCLGERRRFKICQQEACTGGDPTSREAQCTAYNDEKNSWTPYYHHAHLPCSLVCISQENVYSKLSNLVMDGTLCMRGINDVCIGGSCVTIPCDGELGSNAVADACGVCHGDGTSCTVIRGSKTYNEPEKKLQNLIEIPVNATNVLVKETSATNATILLYDKSVNIMKEFLRGTFNIGDTGMTGWIGNLKPLQETLSIKGPVTKPLKVMVHVREPVTISYTMAIENKKSRKPSFTWDFTEWSICSADCGTGSQVAQPQCVEQESGRVENSHCQHLEKPESKMRPCQLKSCSP